MGKMSLHDCRKHYKIALSRYVQCVKAVKKEEGWQGEGEGNGQGNESKADKGNGRKENRKNGEEDIDYGI